MVNYNYCFSLDFNLKLPHSLAASSFVNTLLYVIVPQIQLKGRNNPIYFYDMSYHFFEYLCLLLITNIWMNLFTKNFCYIYRVLASQQSHILRIDRMWCQQDGAIRVFYCHPSPSLPHTEHCFWQLSIYKILVGVQEFQHGFGAKNSKNRYIEENKKNIFTLPVYLCPTVTQITAKKDSLILRFLP